MSTVVGRRVYPDADGILTLAEGDYGQSIHSEWMARPPGCGTGSLASHEVTEHEDGTITVHPSIVVDDEVRGSYHGWLVRGQWS